MPGDFRIGVGRKVEKLDFITSQSKARDQIFLYDYIAILTGSTLRIQSSSPLCVLLHSNSACQEIGRAQV